MSAATGEGIDALLEAVWQQVAASRDRVAASRVLESSPAAPDAASSEPPIRTLTE